MRLEERPNILLEAGGGISTDEGVRTTSRATHRNIAGLGHRLTMLGTGGYGWFGDEWVLDTAEPIWRAAMRYEMPYVPGRGGRLILEGLIHEAIQEPTWRMSRSGGSVGLRCVCPDARPQSSTTVYRSDNWSMSTPARSSTVIPGSATWVSPMIFRVSGLDSGERVVSGGSLLLVYDRRNSGSTQSVEACGRPTSGG